MSPKKRTQDPAKVIVIENQKGGVGKTTIAYHLSCYLAEQGYKTLAIDLDGQGNLSSRFLDRSKRVGGLRSVHLFNDTAPDLKPLDTPDGVDLIYSIDRDVELFNVERMDFDKALINFNENLDPMLDAYDYIVMDTPPAHGNKMSAASITSNYIFVPVEMAAFAVTGVESVLETLAEIQRYVSDRLQVTGVICNRLRPVNSHTEALAELNAAGVNILTARLGTNGAVDDALRDGVPVWKNKRTGAQRETAKSMVSLMQEICGYVGAKIQPPQAKAVAKQSGVTK
ncbi:MULTISPECIES: ParA family protein [Pseudomonas syringae group]|uniref:ParA family protein n=1 Tax=Pseudomonas syringae group TaxID=136849 RepID=UPI000E30DF3D|nr:MULTISPECIES: ParA family protein [Pseudomonas syringae group]